MLPESIELIVVIVPGPSARDLFEFALEVLVQRPGFEPDTWWVRGDFDKAKTLEELGRRGAPSLSDFETLGPDAFERGFSIQGNELGLGINDLALVKSIDDDELVSYFQKDGWRLIDTARPRTAEALRSALAYHEAVVRAALDRFPVHRAHVWRETDDALSPSPPHGDPGIGVAVVDRAQIERDFDDPDAFWSAWETVEHRGRERTLVTRGQTTADETMYRLGVLPATFVMARGARAGLTQYWAPDLSEAESEALDGEERFLVQVGYSDRDRSLEFTAVVPEDAHLSPADIFDILGYLEDGASDGAPVERVVVTFVDEAMARREARVLHDCKATVQFYTSDGDVAALESDVPDPEA